MKGHLVDGTFELFRHFYGPAPKAQTAEGTEVGAVRGLLRTLLSLIQQEDCTHVAVAFDRVIESFRNELFEGYKTGAGVDPELYGQFPLAEQATRSLGVVVWPMVEYEADDAMATGAARFASAVDQVVLASPDKDLAQCVQGDRVIMLDRIRNKVTNEAGVIEKFGVPPAAIPDYLALVGDKADGIPGIPRWGAKSAAALLSAYGTVEAIPDDPWAWSVKVRGAAALAENLRSRRGEARLYRQLATLATDVPLAEELDDLCWRGPNRDRLEALLASIEYERFLERVPQGPGEG